MLENKPLLQSCAGRGGGQGSQSAPSTALAEAAASALASQEGNDLSFNSGPNFVHPPGHAGYVLRLPTAGDAGGVPILDRPWKYYPLLEEASLFVHRAGTSTIPSADLSVNFFKRK